MKMYGIYGHTLPGIFLFDLPLGLLIYWLFQKIIKYPLILHSPLFLRRRFSSFLALPMPQNNVPKLSLQRITAISIAILIGIITHIIWDAFTHATGFFVTLFPLLQQQITLFNITLPLYKLLQQLSSIMGLAAILLYITLLPKTPESLLPPATRLSPIPISFCGDSINNYKLTTCMELYEPIWSSHSDYSLGIFLKFIDHGIDLALSPSKIVSLFSNNLTIRLIKEFNNRRLNIADINRYNSF